jgi:hypothetical protein
MSVPRAVATFAISFAAVFLPATANASCTNSRSEIVCALPDVFFTPGVATKRTFQYHFRTVDNSKRNCGLFARSITPGIRVRQTYGGDILGEPFEWVPIGPATPAGYDKTWTISIEQDGTTPEDTPGLVEVIQNHAADDVLPIEPRLIGTINVHTTHQTYEPTYVARADETNSFGSYVMLSHPLLNGNPSTRVFVTQSYNPGGGSGLMLKHPVAVTYVGGWFQRWFIRTEDGASIPPGSAFNVHIDAGADLHTATSGNSSGSATRYSDGIADNNLNAILLVTPRYDGVANPHPVGVRYTGGKWWIENTNGAAMPVGASFHVKPLGYGIYLQNFGYYGSNKSNGVAIDVGGASRTFGTYREIHYSHSNHANAALFVTPNRSANGGSHSLDPNLLGVWHTSRGSWSGWAVYHQNGALMKSDAPFNLWVPPAPVRGWIVIDPKWEVGLSREGR